MVIMKVTNCHKSRTRSYINLCLLANKALKETHFQQKGTTVSSTIYFMGELNILMQDTIS